MVSSDAYHLLESVGGADEQILPTTWVRYESQVNMDHSHTRDGRKSCSRDAADTLHPVRRGCASPGIESAASFASGEAG
jgi:hypothetical protein